MTRLDSKTAGQLVDRYGLKLAIALILAASKEAVMKMRFPVKFSKATRRAVAKTSDGGPDLGTWLSRIRGINDSVLTEAIDGIWCGRTGEVRIDLPESNALLCMGWYQGRVESSCVFMRFTTLTKTETRTPGRRVVFCTVRLPFP